MGKKTVLIIIVIIIALFYIGYRNRGLYFGLKPAFTSPKENISELIERAKTESEFPFPLSLPEGFSISVFAENLGKPRVLIKDPQGTLLVSITKGDKVVALPDKNNDGIADRIVTVAGGINRPHGLAFREGKLYIAETDQLTVYDYNPETFKASNKKKLVDLPGGGNHFTRTIIFNPSDPNELLISIGSTCNVCIEEDNRRAKILVYDLKTGELKTFASGLRNSVFMAVHPWTQEIWATEMGRDWLGNDLPPDEINIIKEGGNYGWPICYSRNVHDTDFDKRVYVRNPCMEPFETPSYIDIPAHSSPLGLAFFSENWSEEYRYNILVAYHGSWNRTIPTGYKIVRYQLDKAGNVFYVEDFITGWLLQDDGSSLGRPVDILIEPDGVIYISDDKAGVIYRVVYGGDKSEAEVIASFKECAKAGYPVMESYPRQCRTLDGRLFVEKVDDIFPSCIKTGCSGQVCADRDVITTCEFLPEYACYKNTICERQRDGECGWTETKELLNCLGNL